jgi:hypothetical protein
MLPSCADSAGKFACQPTTTEQGTVMRTVKQSKTVQLTGQQIRLGSFDIVWAEVELLLDQGFDTIEIRGVRFAKDEPEPYLSPLEAEARAAEAWYAAHIHMAAPKDK